MNKPMPPTPLRQEDYLAIEAAVMETARGRWFLSEYARRNRNADTDTLLGAIDKLEKSISRERAPASLMNRVKMDLADMAAAIERTKQEIAQIKHEDNDGSERFERASSELDAIVTQTESATGDILGAAEKIQEFAWTLREMGSDEETCNALDMEATNIYMACSFQDLTGQRIKKIVDAMRYVEKRINKMIDIWGFEAGGVEIDGADAKAHDSRPDAHLLNGPALAGEGVEQNDVDALFTQPHDELEANQDDVDALFDGPVSPESDPVEASDAFEMVDADAEMDGFDAVDVEEVAFDAVESDESDAGVDTGVEAVSAVDEISFVEMGDMDWADEETSSQATDPADEAADADAIDPTATDAADVFAGDAEIDLDAADVFAAASVSDNVEPVADDCDSDAVANEEGAGVELSEASEDADVFAGVNLDSVEADVFASADPAEEFEPFDLRDRVADFS